MNNMFYSTLIIKNNKREDMTAIPADRIVTQKEAERKLKYNSLYTEIQRMWNLKCMIIPVIISHWNSNKRFKEKFGSHSRKMFNVFTTKDGYTWNITHNTENFIV
jgi:hypothetical protein